VPKLAATPRIHTLLVTAALLLIVGVGAWFRTLNIAGWDGGTGFHPDERYIQYTVAGLRMPTDWRDYFRTTCPDPLPVPRNPEAAPDKLEPSTTSGCSTLNPRNFDWSRNFQYGSLPLTVTRWAAETWERTAPQQIVVLGRSLGALADTLTILTVFFLGQLIYNRRVGLLAAAFYACAVMPLQQAHYFTADSWAVCFGALALLFITRLALRGGWNSAVLSGVCIGAAMACKINMAALALLVPLAALQAISHQPSAISHQRKRHAVQVVGRAALLVGAAGVVAFTAFRLLQPDAFAGPNWWNIALDERFRTTTREARLTANGTRDLPYLIQWAGRARWWYGWQNMVVWGMGVPLGIAAWLGWAVAGWQIVARRHAAALVPFVWVLGYFGWIGAQLLMTMRYLLPIYPALMVFAAWVLLEGTQRIPDIETLKGWKARTLRIDHRSLIIRRWSLVVGRWSFVVPLVVLLATFGWAWAYTRIYTQPYTRVAAAQWLQQQEPDGAITTFEVWDDPLPLGGDQRFKQVPTAPYAEEELNKYLRTDADITKAGLINQLAQADYVVLTSPRVYGSVSRIPQRFPAINRYYQALFDGSLGFEQVAAFTSFPQLGTVRIDDTGAEEAFWVYDHPRVTIFRRTGAFSVERAAQIITGGVVWDEIYRGLRPNQVNQAPTALLLTNNAWQRWRSNAVPLLGSNGSIGAVLVWLVAIEGLGLAMCGLVWRMRVPLPDRGLSLARVLGLALWTVPPALLGAMNVVSISRMLLGGWYALLVLVGGLLLWRERRGCVHFARSRRWQVWTPQVVYALLVVLGLALTTTGAPASQVAARWVALAQTPTLPAPDLFFAGGHDPLPYAAQLPFALLSKLLGIAPALGLALALATALALAIVGLWSAAHAMARRSNERRWQALALLLVALPGLPLLITTGFNPWLALTQFNLDALALVALVAAVLALGTGVSNARSMLILLPLLILLRGYGLLVVLAVGLAVVAGAGGVWRGNTRRTRLLIVVLAGTLVLGSPFAWSVAPPALQDIALIDAVLGFVTSMLVPLIVLVWWALNAQPMGERCSWLLVAIAAALLAVALLVLGGMLPGNAEHLLTVASVLLVVTAGRVLPQLQMQRRTRGVIRWQAATAVLFGMLLGFSTLTTVAARAESPVPGDLVVQQAAPSLAATNGVLVAAPQAAAEWSAATSVPALIAAPERETRLRSLLEPAVNAVIDGRRKTIETIYGPDADAARRALAAYHVGYVVLGPTERALFPTAPTTFDALVADNVVGRVYDENDVTIYKHNAPNATPPWVAQTVDLQPRTEPSLLLDQPVGALPAVNEYAWNDLANQYPLLGVLLWLAVIEVAGLLAFPLVRRVFQRWHDHGWGISKIVGLLLWGYGVWLPVSLGWWTFTRWSLVWSMLALGILGFGLKMLERRNRLPVRRASFVVRRSSLIRSEICFLAAFTLWTLVRAANPDVWHPIYGGEKPFEFGFLNAILRSPVMPPYDPFFSDGVINYYYYGLFLMALPVKATGIAPAVGFNLALATVFALVVTATLALGRQLSGRWRWGLLAVFFLVGVGPLASAFAVGEGRGQQAVRDALDGGLAGFGARLGAWFWGPSRIITEPGYTINEFPLFAFLFADLHPHLIALPVTLLAIACALELARRRPSAGLVALSALALGTLAVANSWDAPTYALVLDGALVGRTWQRARGRVPLRRVIMQLGGVALLAIGMLAGGVALYWPFFSHYQAQVGGIGFVQGGDRVLDWALWFGPFLFVAVSLLGVLLWHAAWQSDKRWRWAARSMAIMVPLLPIALLLSGFVQQGIDDGLPLRIVLGALSGVGAGVALAVPLSLRRWFPVWLFSVGLMVALGIQIIFVRDHLAGGTGQRMNTVFKFGFQIWTLWALGATTAIPLLVCYLRRRETLFGMWIGALVCLLLPGLLYPFAAIPSRLSTRFDPTQPLTLDGLAFMDRGTYRFVDESRNIDAQIILQPDADAIRWLNENINGTPVFLTSEREFYRAYGMRIAANTGLPTVLGKLHQDEQRLPAVVAEREQDVQTLWNTADLAQTQQLLRRYRVEYVYVGPIERVLYAPEGIAKWEQLQGTLLTTAYQNSGVTIYRVEPMVLAQMAPNDVGESAAADVETATLEAAFAADPDNSSAAFTLGQQYLERDRAAEAVRTLEAAARTHPDDVPLHHLLGDALAQVGRTDDALAAWQHTVDVARTPNNLTKLGRELLDLDRWNDAERTLNEALALDPAFAEALWALGEVYRVRGDRDQAIAQYQQCVDRVAADSPWHAAAAKALVSLGVPTN